MQAEVPNVSVPRIEITALTPGAGLVGGTVQLKVSFTKSGTGGSGTYWYYWTIDGQEQPRQNNVNTFNYTIPAGDQNAKQITVKCTVTDTEDASIKDDGDITFWQVKITLKRDGAEITGTPEVWAGARMNLSAEILPSGAARFQKMWTIADYAIADYQVNETSAHVVPLSPSQLENPAVIYYWVDGRPAGTQKKVKFALTINGTCVETENAFMVKKPEFSVNIEEGEVQFLGSLLLGTFRLSYGDATTLGSGVRLTTSQPYDRWWIQTAIVDAHRYGFPCNVAFGRGLDAMIHTDDFCDSPCVGLGIANTEGYMWLRCWAYAMYTCGTPGSIVVPVAYRYWYVIMKAESNSAWSITQSIKGHSGSLPASGITFPEWDGRLPSC